MHRFKLSHFAESDVFEILNYTIDKWSFEQAEQYQRDLELGRLEIQKDPYLLNSKSQDRLAKGCRSFKVNHHYFFYRVDELENSIEIARILHESRDFPRHVSDSHYPV